MNFIEKIQNNAKRKNTNKIVFPEGLEPRMIKAVRILKDRQLIVPILLGDREQVKNTASKEGISLGDILIVDPANSENIEAYAEEYFQLRKHKGMTVEEANKIVKDPLFFAAFMVRKGEAQGAVAGSINTTGDVLRAAIQVVGLAPGIKVVSSCFIMILKDGSESHICSSSAYPRIEFSILLKSWAIPPVNLPIVSSF